MSKLRLSDGIKVKTKLYTYLLHPKGLIRTSLYQRIIMFENRSEKELIVIYVIIALLFALGFTAYNISPFSAFPKDPILIVVVANVLFFCMFYILYLPIKVKKAREREEKEKKKKTK